MRRAAPHIVLLVLLFVAVQPSVAKVVVDAKPSAVSLAVSDRTVSTSLPANDRGIAAHPLLPQASLDDPNPYVTEFYGPASQAATPKVDWKTKRMAQVRKAWNKAVSWIF